jgi:hypothetical protein
LVGLVRHSDGDLVPEQLVLNEPDLVRLRRDTPGGHRGDEQESNRE